MIEREDRASREPVSEVVVAWRGSRERVRGWKRIAAARVESWRGFRGRGSMRFDDVSEGGVVACVRREEPR